MTEPSFHLEQSDPNLELMSLFTPQTPWCPSEALILNRAKEDLPTSLPDHPFLFLLFSHSFWPVQRLAVQQELPATTKKQLVGRRGLLGCEKPGSLIGDYFSHQIIVKYLKPSYVRLGQLIPEKHSTGFLEF